MEKNNKSEWTAHIASIGSSALYTFSRHPQAQTIGEAFQSTTEKPQFITSHNGMLAIIDNKNSLWLVGNAFTNPLNLSDVLKMRVKRVFLGEGQVILQSRRRSWVIANWSGKIDLPPERMTKITINNKTWNNIIDAYSLDVECNPCSFWYYSSLNKVENSIKLYFIDALTHCITGYPLQKNILLPQTISGISLGKYHALCWSSSGNVYAWGCKSLALGLRHYEKNYYEQAQKVNLPQSICKAFAGTNYSLALSVSGKLYEWGISSSGQPIISPRLVCLSKSRFVELKGFDNVIAALTSNNQLYVWGKGSQKITNEDCHLEAKNAYLVPKRDNIKIDDYTIEERSISLIISKNDGKLSRGQHLYFQEMVRKTSQNWIPNKLKTQKNQQSLNLDPLAKRQNCSKVVPFESVRKNEDYIDRIIGQKNNKEEYFMIVQDQQSLFKHIMRENATNRVCNNGRNSVKSGLNSPRKTTQKRLNLHRKVESARLSPVKLHIDIESSNKFVREYQAERAYLRNRCRKLKMPEYHKRENSSYEDRLNAVIIKKEQIEQKKHLERVKLIQKKTSVLKRQRRQESQLQFENEKKQMTKLHTFLNKLFLVRLMQGPLELGREIKIQQFANHMSVVRISTSMRNTLNKKRAIAFLKKLVQTNVSAYQLIKKVVIRGIRRWKLKKSRAMMTIVVSSLVKYRIISCVNLNLGKIWLSTRKIQRMAKWLWIEQRDRMLQLKLMWKKSLLLCLKPTPAFENKRPSSCREQLSLKLTDRIKHPRLANYLQACPIIKWILPREVAIKQLISNCSHSLSLQNLEMIVSPINDLQQKKSVNWVESQVIQTQTEAKIKDTERNQSVCPGNSVHDIMLYSQHYDYFYQPKNYQINIPDCMKHSQKWILEERRIFNKAIKQILITEWKRFYESRLEFQTKLAYFIKNNYEALTQHRWKYIIQYNKIKTEPSNSIQRKEKQLYKLLSSIDALHLLLNDVIPEKHKIMDYVRTFRDAPVPPTLEVTFSQQDFKKYFKSYYESVLSKAKLMRKFYN